jgi:hypothetical protein
MFPPALAYNSKNDLFYFASFIEGIHSDRPGKGENMQMNRMNARLNEVDLIGKLADLKEEHYKNTLVLSALIELLVEKGLITTKELENKAVELDSFIPETSYPIS